MALLDRLKDAVGVGGDQDLNGYHCRNCGMDFRAGAARADDVRCPSCRASGRQAIEPL